MNYEIINTETWERGELFRFYIEKLRNVMSMTVDTDVTKLVSFVRAHGLKFYPAMMWAVSKAVNGRAEFRYGWKDGDLVRWDYVSPYYADFHGEDERFVKLVTEYSGDLSEFHARFLADRERYKDLRAFDLKEIPPNTFDVSCLPWVRYRSFDIHVFDEGRYLAPVVTWGRFETENGKTVMPLSVNIHHAVADGWHLSRLFADVQEIINTL
ncbi:MAG TPA: hypothetical protein H9726_05510 [Candidatus Borkfalkia avicola]|uniref:Chloramphenicol acetyltransferase n=1 Tax=Candidatus Borkfalkia avicola TaxID=2838503 RepID=A0A9D2IIT8_9FIRM|nr:hypothetical protein [Candidatus Borkfalkia avicola]